MVGTCRHRPTYSHTNECWPLDGVSISGSPFQLPYPDIPVSLLPCSPASRIAVILPPRVHHPHPPFPLWRAVLVLRTCLCRFMAAFCCLMIPLGTICTLWLFTGRRHPVSPIHNHPGPFWPIRWTPKRPGDARDDLRWWIPYTADTRGAAGRWKLVLVGWAAVWLPRLINHNLCGTKGDAKKTLPSFWGAAN